MKKQYERVETWVEQFDGADVLTASASSFDGTGEIPESWWNS